MKKDLITLADYSPEQILQLLHLSEQLKHDRNQASDALKGKSVGLVFQKSSNRTRTSFAVGVHQLGGFCLYLGPKEINLGKREATSDVAKTLSRYLDCIVARTYSHQDVLDLAKFSTVPVINGLSDLYHPCQALADIFTVKEKFHTFEGITLAYIGDGNNVCHSLMLACAKVGLNMKVGTPVNYEPSPEILKVAQVIAAEKGVSIEMTHNPREAVNGAHVIYTDVWVSMGQEEETQKRLQDFEAFQINADLVSSAAKDFIFMHCLPAHRDEEVTADVIDGAHSVVFDQAENRLHVQKAVMLDLMVPEYGK